MAAEKAVSIDLGDVLELLTLAESNARQARELICLERQMGKVEKTMASGLVVAGSAVLTQIQNGDARVVQNVKGQTPEQAAFQQQLDAVRVGSQQSLRNVLLASDQLKAKLGLAPAA